MMATTGGGIELAAGASALEGVRVLFLCGERAGLNPRLWECLALELRRRGATTARYEAPGDASDSIAHELATFAVAFAPSILVFGGSAAAAEFAARAGVPTVHLARVDRCFEGRDDVVWVDDAGKHEDAAEALIARIHQARHTLQQARVASPEHEGRLVLGRDDLIAHLLASTPRGVHTRQQIEAYVDQAVELGMPTLGSGPSRTFDLVDADNWLCEFSAPFQERATAYRRARCLAGLTREARTAEAPGLGRQLRREQRCRVTFQVDLDLTHLEEGTRYRLYLPFPVAAETQKDVRFVDAHPTDIAGALADELGFIYGAERRVGSDGRESSGYRADVSTAELFVPLAEERRQPAPDVASFSELRAYARTASDDPVQRAFYVYDWMSRVGRVRRVRRSCVCFECSAAHFDAHHEGDCILLAHAFVHCCAHLGVPARPVRGALFDAPQDEAGRRFGVGRVGSQLATHTWAEFLDPRQGWIPVEFLGLALGPVAPSASWDKELEAALEEDRGFLRELYFGRVDNQRIVYSRSALVIPTVLVHDMTQRRGRRWVPLDRARTVYRHDVEVLSGPSSPA